MQNPNARIVALDVGTKRIGVASANVVARLASPLKTLEMNDDAVDTIAKLVAAETAEAVVVGLPRGMGGEDTDQTRYTRDFVKRLKEQLSIPIYWQDEAVTSRLSEDSLKAVGKPYDKGSIDALAACYILEDYLNAKKAVAA